MYRSLGLHDRVTQLFGDSLGFDHLFMGKEFFDSVFIDGGHQVEVVSSDQRNAVEMLRPGGVVIWHDYSGDEAVLKDHPSCHGVVSAIYENLEFLESKLDLFWLEGTFLLIGVKKAVARVGPLSVSLRESQDSYRERATSAAGSRGMGNPQLEQDLNLVAN
jgi:hypothetical protein